MEEKRFERAAAYLRLSRGDVNGSFGKGFGIGESDSIAAQRRLCVSFIQGRDDMELYDIYVDDGYSGTNFVEVR